MGFDYRSHVFYSPQFKSVVEQAIQFLLETSAYKLPFAERFPGAGVYALYYTGDNELYADVAKRNRQKIMWPIYVGKAVPPGWRTARPRSSAAPVLYQRLREHAKSIELAENLNIDDFLCRFVILEEMECDLIVPIEAELIRRYKPLWNSVIDGFGNHDPGSGRYNQAMSEWDVLHPGRPWAARLTGPAPHLDDIIARLRAGSDSSFS